MSNRRSVTMFRFAAVLLLSAFAVCTAAKAEERSKVVTVVGDENGYVFEFQEEAVNNYKIAKEAVRTLHNDEDLTSIALSTTGRKVSVTGICPERHFKMHVSTTKPRDYVFEFADANEKVEGAICKEIGRFTYCIAADNTKNVSLSFPTGKIIATAIQ